MAGESALQTDPVEALRSDSPCRLSILRLHWILLLKGKLTRSDESRRLPAPMPEFRPTILVIEDEPPLKKLLRITLESQDYRVIEATHAAEGIRQAASLTPDLIILDLGLPDCDGVDVARRVREWSAIPIIVVSARGK